MAAYTYMSLVPMVQPPIIKLFTTRKDRAIRMDALRPVSKRERILFPIVCTMAAGLILPASVPLIGLLMFGNLLRECGVTERLSQAAQNEILNTVTILLGLSVGATMGAESFLTTATIKIIILGLVAFIFSTAGGTLFGQLMKVLSGGKINPMIRCGRGLRCPNGSEGRPEDKRQGETRRTSFSCTPWDPTWQGSSGRQLRQARCSRF